MEVNFHSLDPATKQHVELTLVCLDYGHNLAWVPTKKLQARPMRSEYEPDLIAKALGVKQDNG